LNLSVIVPVLNESEHLAETLRVLRAHDTASDLHEIIVADGGSTDMSLDIANISGAKVIHVSTAGRARQMNVGAASAMGDVLLFVHGDTRMPENYSELIKRAQLSGYKSGCFRLRFDHPSRILQFYGWCTRFDLDFMRFGDQGFFITKDEFDRSGGYREDHRVLEDNELTRRIRKAGVPFKILEKSATTSARRYIEQGVIRLQFIFSAIYMMWRMGASQDRLVSFYRRMVHNRVPE